ncbi:hypothetical protein CIL05_14710 [Virgibacillus profundi]|uniref:RNase H type-1 domain-containing protein n=1 Tax=Virgibacillus profundi TaxID=2024555 RepID=A0A2A2IC72_9BACI|nr:ribonuclease H family protein [Virgibacillus profundi]PAV28874.1 hypothetical protein CIL05_14710 [Virgibacillus profundi]PXY53042.1 hypothetical protein CIT14_14835 [Virgibacillus profundi]
MNVRIEITYRTPKGTEAVFSSEEMRAKHALLITEDLEKTGRIKNLVFIDTHDNTWNLKEFKKLIEEIQTEPHDVTVYFDGGFDFNTRKSGLGCVIYYEQNGKSLRLRKNALVEELESNNEAEYASLHLTLKELEHLGVHHLPVIILGDSQVVINQLKEDWPCYEENLARWADRIENKIDKMGLDVTFKQIPRKTNQEADRLATQALRGIDILSTSEVD